MAGRGCTVELRIYRDLGDVFDTRYLSVAQHSPLAVLKEQIEEVSGIAVPDQVLILLDLDDPDRNSDEVLGSTHDHETLREFGIKDGSVITLHSLSRSYSGYFGGESNQWGRSNAMNEDDEENFEVHDRNHSEYDDEDDEDDEDYDENDGYQNGFNGTPYYFDSDSNTSHKGTNILETQIAPRMADHSYNGIIFDVMNKGPLDIRITSIFLGGMLGRLRIYVRDNSWEQSPGVEDSNRWWAHHSGISAEGWKVIHDGNHAPAWDNPVEIVLDEPISLYPHQVRGIYCHSGLPDDLGIQYQSYSQSAIVGENDHLSIHPGLGHTGHEPFDGVNGWYRSWRGLAGALKYEYRWKSWHPICMQVPISQSASNKRSGQSMVCDGDDNDNNDNDETVNASSSSSPSLASETACYAAHSDYIVVPCNSALNSAVTTVMMCHRRVGTGGHPLGKLPQYLVYYIMEFMHWDWFEEQYGPEYQQLKRETFNSYRMWSDCVPTPRRCTDPVFVQDPDNFPIGQYLGPQAARLSHESRAPRVAAVEFRNREMEMIRAYLSAVGYQEFEHDDDDDDDDDDDERSVDPVSHQYSSEDDE